MIPYVCILKQKNKLNSFKYIPSSLLCWPPPRGTLRNLKFLSWAWAGNWEEIQGSPFLTWWRGSSSPPNLLGSPVKAYPCLLRLVWKLNESTCHQANINCKELLGINLLKSKFTHLKKKWGVQSIIPAFTGFFWESKERITWGWSERNSCLPAGRMQPRGLKDTPPGLGEKS